MSDDLAVLQARLHEVDREWCEAVRAGDVERVLSFWAEDAVVMAPGAPALVGKSAIRAFVEQSFGTPGFSISWHTDQFIVGPAGDLAYGTGTNRTTYRNAAGELIEVLGKGATVWRNEGAAGWKCVLDIWNDAPAAQ